MSAQFLIGHWTELRVAGQAHLAKFLEERWRSPWGLLVGLLSLLVLLRYLVGEVEPWGAALALNGLVAALIVGVWAYSRRLPRAKSGRVGFGIALKYESKELRARVAADFVQTVRELLLGGAHPGAFDFLEIPDYLAERVEDLEDAQELARKTRCHFLLFGRVRTRKIEGKPHHFVNMQSLVSHKPIPDAVSAALAREMNEVLPRRVRLDEENDLIAFELLSQWTEIAAKYFVGIAAGLSGDLDHADRLFGEVDRELESAGGVPQLEIVRKRLPVRRTELCEARLPALHAEWRKNPNPETMNQIGSILAQIPREHHLRPGNVLARAIWMFCEGEVDAAIGLLNKADLRHDNSFHYSLAFLYAYNGNLKKAIRSYRQLDNLPLKPEILNQVEDFFGWILEEEPEKTQLRFALGFLYRHVKEDLRSAQRELKRFLEETPVDRFQNERRLAEVWLEEIEGAVRPG